MFLLEALHHLLLWLQIDFGNWHLEQRRVFGRMAITEDGGMIQVSLLDLVASKRVDA